MKVAVSMRRPVPPGRLPAHAVRRGPADGRGRQRPQGRRGRPPGLHPSRFREPIGTPIILPDNHHSIGVSVNRCLPALLLLLLIVVPAVGHDPDSYEPDTLTLTFLDVGQGDAILVQAANGQAMLVDAGEASAAPNLSSRLAAKGVTHLAYLVGTHDHDDHIGGMASLVGSLAVDEYLENGDPAASQTAAALHQALALRGIPSRNLTAGETIPLDPANITVTVLNPQPVRSGDEDEDSIVLRLVWGETSFFLAGDAGTGAEGRILASGLPLDRTYFTFLKVGHHGSDTATGAPFVAAVQPNISVIECGRYNPYHHPSGAVVKRLQDAGSDVFTTASGGEVRIISYQYGYVEYSHGGQLPVTVEGASLPPTDPDFDGLYEDVNGNGRKDFEDVVFYFNRMTWIDENERWWFDFNDNDRIDFGDVVRLFDLL